MTILHSFCDSMIALSMKNIHKSFGETRALAGVSFDVAQGQIMAVLGPSGCGKSTLLNVIAGLEQPDEGTVFWDGESLAGVPPHNREFGLMFQDFALFPHMNVSNNIAFGLKMAKLSPSETHQSVTEMLELVNLSGFGERDVDTLSGGEQQRVALARSFAPRPRLLMLDEPLGALDRTLRERLMVELRVILRQMRQTALYITHDQEEAFAVADRVVVMRTGRVEQIGTPQEIYRQPASVFVARFLGFSNLLEGVVHRANREWVVETEVGAFTSLPNSLPSGGEERQVTVLLRPDAVRVVEGESMTRHEQTIEGTVMEQSFRGNTSRATVEANGVALEFDFPASTERPTEGEAVRLGFKAEEAVQVFW